MGGSSQFIVCEITQITNIRDPPCLTGCWFGDLSTLLSSGVWGGGGRGNRNRPVDQQNGEEGGSCKSHFKRMFPFASGCSARTSLVLGTYLQKLLKGNTWKWVW